MSMTRRELILDLLASFNGDGLDDPVKIEAAGEVHDIDCVRYAHGAKAVLITTDATLYTERDMIKAACKEPV